MIPASKLPYTVEIQAKGITYDPEGIPIEGWETAATVRADIQPLGGELAQREYGIVEQGISFRMFCNPSDAVRMARRVVHNGAVYQIRHVAAYRGHVEALLRPEVI